MTPAARSIVLSNRVAWSFMGDGSRVWDFTRASDGTRVNPAGSWETIGTNGLRYDFDPTTGTLRGVLVEPARINGNRNSACQGGAIGVIGSGGVLPTYFYFAPSGNVGTLAREVVAIGVTESGINYVDLRLFGTPTGAGFLQVLFDDSLNFSAVSGDVCVASLFVRMSAGSLANTSGYSLGINEYTAAGAYVTGASSPISLTAGDLNVARSSYIRTLSGGGTVAKTKEVFIALYSAGAVDITFRFGWPSLERVDSGASVATTPIITTGSAATRAADVLSLPIPPGTYGVEVIGGTVLQAGTRYTDTVTVTGAAWDFAWPTAAIAAGERHLQRVSMRRIG